MSISNHVKMKSEITYSRFPEGRELFKVIILLRQNFEDKDPRRTHWVILYLSVMQSEISRTSKIAPNRSHRETDTGQIIELRLKR